MATTTLKAILDRLEAVCEAPTGSGGLALQPSQVPFSLEREPNATVERAYYLEDAGLSESKSGTSQIEFRVDEITIWIAQRLAFAAQTAMETMHTNLNTLERLVLADGPANSYHAKVVSRKGPARLGESDVLVAGLTLLVDYDFTTATS